MTNIISINQTKEKVFTNNKERKICSNVLKEVLKEPSKYISFLIVNNEDIPKEKAGVALRYLGDRIHINITKDFANKLLDSYNIIADKFYAVHYCKKKVSFINDLLFKLGLRKIKVLIYDTSENFSKDIFQNNNLKTSRVRCFHNPNRDEIILKIFFIKEKDLDKLDKSMDELIKKLILASKFNFNTFSECIRNQFIRITLFDCLKRIIKEELREGK